MRYSQPRLTTKMAIKTKMNKKTPRNLVSKKNQSASDDALKQGKKKQMPKTDDKNDKLHNIVMDKKRLKSGKNIPKGVQKKPVGDDNKTTNAKATKATIATAVISSKIKNNANEDNAKPKKRTRLSKKKELSSINKTTSTSKSPEVDIPNQVNEKSTSENPKQPLVGGQKIKTSKKTKSTTKSKVVELMKLVTPFRDYEVRICDIMRSNLEARDVCRG